MRKYIVILLFSNSVRYGRCMTLKACYPYFKIFELGSQDTWVMGSYDTCSFTSAGGKHVRRIF